MGLGIPYHAHYHGNAHTMVYLWFELFLVKKNTGMGMYAPIGIEVNRNSGWWFGTCFFPIQLGMSSSQLTNSYFSEGLVNHQPVYS